MVPKDAVAIDPELASAVDSIVSEFGGERHRLMDIVQAVQRRYGYVSHEAVCAIAKRLRIHAVEVEDMLSFYTFLNRSPRGRFHIRVSKTPVSLMKGAAEVMHAFLHSTGALSGGEFTVEWTSDIGMADQEPAALVNDTVLTELSPAQIPALVAGLREHANPSLLPNAKVGSSLTQAGPVVFRGGGKPGDGIRAALALSPEAVIKEISNAKLRGRGGAGFPTALKWRLCREQISDGHHVVCNADEGEPGTFKDRVLLTLAPDLMFDGMTIGAYAIGAKHGLIYLRGEYAYLWDSLTRVLENRRRLGLLGSNICGVSNFDFEIRMQLGAGAYICGEESALIESLEGKRGAPRDRPPFPTERGYLQQPTAVDNVETFACVARILEQNSEWFAGYGTPDSAGTKLLSVSGDCPRPGVYEVPFGLTVNELLDLVGAADAGFVQVGGPSGQCVAPKDFGRRIAFEDLATGGSIMVFGPARDALAVALQFTEFFVDESCGWCTPCRVGTTLMKKEMEKLLANRGTLGDVSALEALANTVMRMSRCGLGQTSVNPILSTMRNFPELYEARLRPESFAPRVTLSEALGQALRIRKGEHA